MQRPNPPAPFPEREGGALAFSPSPLRGGGWGEGFCGKPQHRKVVRLGGAAGEDHLVRKRARSAAIVSRAPSSACRALRPVLCAEDGFPAGAARIPSHTSGRTGVVALWSR